MEDGEKLIMTSRTTMNTDMRMEKQKPNSARKDEKAGGFSLPSLSTSFWEGKLPVLPTHSS